MGGLQPSDLIIIAGRPAMGKTALATNIAFNVAKARLSAAAELTPTTALDGAVVGFFSLEMSAEQLATRILSEQAGYPLREHPPRHDRRRRVRPHRRGVARRLQHLPLYIDQTGGISIAQLAARARRLKRQRGLGLIVVDYLQLLSGSAKRAAEGRVQEVSEITTGLKALAKELNVPVLALSQLSAPSRTARTSGRSSRICANRAPSSRTPTSSCSCSARNIIWSAVKPREGTNEYQDWLAKMEMVNGKAEVIIGKQRHGPTGTVTLQFDGGMSPASAISPPRAPAGAAGVKPQAAARARTERARRGRRARARSSPSIWPRCAPTGRLRELRPPAAPNAPASSRPMPTASAWRRSPRR